MAEHFLNVLSGQTSNLGSLFQVKAADILCEMGQQLLQDRQHEMAVKWLSRASTMIEQTQDSCAMVDTQNLRLNVLHTYGECCSSFDLAQI